MAGRAKERVANGGSLIPAQNGPYAKLVSKEPGKLVNAYKEYDVPADVEALKMSWKWEVKNLKTGEKPWFDARVLFKFKDANGKEVKNPSPVYIQKDTKGWQNRETSFLVPKEAVTFVVMPCLFQVKSGEMEMTDVTAPAPPTFSVPWPSSPTIRYLPASACVKAPSATSSVPVAPL